MNGHGVDYPPSGIEEEKIERVGRKSEHILPSMSSSGSIDTKEILEESSD